jgi:hypothetical protein
LLGGGQEFIGSSHVVLKPRAALASGCARHTESSRAGASAATETSSSTPSGTKAGIRAEAGWGAAEHAALRRLAERHPVSASAA